MKISVFYPTGSTAWSITRGISTTLSSMGHEVLDCTIETPDYEALRGEDLILVSGPEYLWKELRVKFPLWDELKAAKVGWLHETVEREDYNTNGIAVNGTLPISDIKKITPILFTPAIQDQRFDLKYLPFGVDTKMFYPRPPKEGGSLYTGSLYKKRRDFINTHPEIRTLSAYREYNTPEEYAESISKVTVVFELPSLSALSTTRVFEVLASKTLLITHSLEFSDSLFSSGHSLIYYSDDPNSAFSSIRGEEKRIAQQGYDEVLSKHTIEHRLKIMLESASRPLRPRPRR